MIRNMKALIGALLATMLFASTASAAEFHSSTATTTITGAQTTQLTFTVNSGQIKCTTATVDGKIAGTTVSSIELNATLAGCKAFGLAATVHMNDCDLKETNSGSTTVTVDIVCHVGAKIEITTPGCEVTIGAQTGLSTATAANIAAGDISQSVNLSGVHYVEHGASCALAGTSTEGTLTGAIVLNGNDTGSNISYS